MPRVKRGVTARARHKKIIDQVPRVVDCAHQCRRQRVWFVLQPLHEWFEKVIH